MLTDLVNVTDICQSGNVLAEIGWCIKSAGIFIYFYQICQSGNLLTETGRGVNLLADLVTVTKSACQQICW